MGEVEAPMGSSVIFVADSRWRSPLIPLSADELSGARAATRSDRCPPWTGHPRASIPATPSTRSSSDPSNQFAHAACRAVAEAPLALLQSAVHLRRRRPRKNAPDARGPDSTCCGTIAASKLTYISAERFMNEMINAVRYDRIIDFRERYRTVDVLLVDDVQFIAGKEGTQTEFFHTFNALYDSQKQIVHQQRLPAARDSVARGAAALAIRVGVDRRYSVAGSRNQDRHSRSARPTRKRSRCPTTWPSTSPAGSSRTSASSRVR